MSAAGTLPAWATTWPDASVTTSHCTLLSRSSRIAASSGAWVSSPIIEFPSGCATAVATAWTTSSDSRVIDFSPEARRIAICVVVRSSIALWPNHVAAPTATATTIDIVRMSLAEIGIPPRALIRSVTTVPA